MGKPLNIWERKEYSAIIENEWFALGMIDPGQFLYEGKLNKLELNAAIDHECAVKALIYKIRTEDANKNKYLDERHGIIKYNPGYEPIPWNEAQAEAFKKLGRPNYKYIYSPFDTSNIDDFYFDHELGDIWCNFLEKFCMHVEGELTNQLVLLTVEQRAFYRNIFGWKYKYNGKRRYSEVWKYIPRKNSKTFDLASLAIGIFLLDGEGGCKIVAVATSLKQAKYAFEPARQMIIKDKMMKVCGGQLGSYFKVLGESITANSDNDTFIPIAYADSSAHGGNFHVSILDEVHEMDGSSMYDVCVTSQGSRQQPLIIMITTAATAEENFCNLKLQQHQKICRGEIEMDRNLPILYYADPIEFQDDWRDKHVHKRVNPMLGLAKTNDYMEKMFQNAVVSPPFENTFKRLDLNWITQSLISAFNSVAWNKCAQKLKPPEFRNILKQDVPNFLLGKRCYAGLDLAGKNDLCALTLDFPDSKYILSWSWTPLRNNKIKNKERFVEKLIICGEEIIDFRELREDIIKLLSLFNVIELGFDSRFATELIQLLEEETNIPVCEVKQSAQHINEALRIAIDDIHSEKVMHNGCPLLTWQIGNCQLKEDAHECFMIKKSGSHSPNKIDAAAAWINARVLKLVNKGSQTLIQRYEETGSYF